MKLHELKELLESRREYVATEAASDRITALQRDLDLLKNEYEQEIGEVLNGAGYPVQSVAFNIDIDTGHRIEISLSDVRHTKVKKRMIRLEGSDSEEKR